MEDMLTAQEASKLTGKSARYYQELAKQGRIAHVKTVNEYNRPKNLFPITAFDVKFQLKYYDQQKQEMKAEREYLQQPINKPLDLYTEAEREEISFWIDLTNEWQVYRNQPGIKSKTEADEGFVLYIKNLYPERGLSVDTLYRRWNAVRLKYYDDLVDQRGKWRKGKSSIDERLWQAFLSFYLDEAQHPLKRCYEYTKLWAREDFPELVTSIPDYTTFYRRVKQELPEPLVMLGREGEKAYRDRCAPYIRRIYDDMASNEWWVADNHTFDIQTMGENGQIHRLYLTAFFDARSGIFTGCYVTNAPSSQATLIALRKGILKYGIPDNIYVDNGREFLTFDIGGLGHRQKKPKDGKERFDPPPVFKRLGINMTNAIVRNAKAKIIERRFRDIKDHLSRLFETFTGGNVLERPEKLKDVLKNGEIPTDNRLTEVVEELLDWYFNQQEYGGAVVVDRGKPRMQVYNEQLHRRRVAPAEELNLMLMRSARPQKVTRRGVHLDIAGHRIDYWNDDMIMNLIGKQVYFRYDPDDLSEIRLYNLEDQYIMSAPADNTAVLKYGASKDDVKAAISKVHRMEKLTKEALKISAYPAFGKRTALELVMEAAHDSKTARIIPEADPKVHQLHRAVEDPLFKEAVGFADLDVMNKNAMKKQGGNESE